jgi:hypothetical protein
MEILSGTLCYVITMTKPRQIFIEEILKEYNLKSLDLFASSRL